MFMLLSITMKNPDNISISLGKAVAIVIEMILEFTAIGIMVASVFGYKCVPTFPMTPFSTLASLKNTQI